MSNRRLIKLFVASTLSALTACGGGGGGGNSPPPPPPPPATYSLSATVSGLNGTVVIQMNGASDRNVTANGTLAIASGLASGSSYSITVLTQPANPAQTCTVTNGSGTIAANVSNVAIDCANIPLALNSSTPADNATNIARDVAPVLTFSRTVDAATVVPANITMSSAAGPQPITLGVAGTAVTINHTNRLLPLAEYAIDVATAVRGAAAEQLANPASLRFTTADGQWANALRIDTSNAGNAMYPQIAFDGLGNALAIWQQYDGTRYNMWYGEWVAGGGWLTRTTIEIGTGTAVHPQIAVNANGDALAVYQQAGVSYMSTIGVRYTRGTGWIGFGQSLEGNSLGGTQLPQVCIDAQGRGVAVWEQSDGTRSNIWARQYDGDSWTSLHLVETDNTGSALRPKVAMAANGIAHIVWIQSDGTRYNLYANTLELGSAVGAPVLLETNNAGDAGDAQIATDSAGNAIVVWAQTDGASVSAWSSRRPVGGSWGAAQLIETAAGHISDPRIAVDRNGNALAVWAQNDGTRNNIWANRYSTGGGWGTATLVELNNAGPAVLPTVTFDPSGNALAIWTQFDGTSYDIWSNRHTPAGGWSMPIRIETGTGSSMDPQLAIDGNGNALAIWSQQQGGQNLIFANRLE